jgi:hypothetical protein
MSDIEIYSDENGDVFSADGHLNPEEFLLAVRRELMSWLVTDGDTVGSVEDVAYVWYVENNYGDLYLGDESDEGAMPFTEIRL